MRVAERRRLRVMAIRTLKVGGCFFIGGRYNAGLDAKCPVRGVR